MFTQKHKHLKQEKISILFNKKNKKINTQSLNQKRLYNKKKRHFTISKSIL